MSIDLSSYFKQSGANEAEDALISVCELLRPTVEVIQQFQETVKPLVAVVSQFQPLIIGLGKEIARIVRPLSAIEKLGKAQFVYWGNLAPGFVEEIITSDDTDKTLSEYISRDKCSKINDTIENTLGNPVIKKRCDLYKQSIEAFRSRSYDLAVTGLTSVFDGLLADVSNNQTHKLQPRIDAVKEKLEREEFLDQSDYGILTLALTLEKTMDAFSSFSSFSEDEPEQLNRHWISHGRSTRKKTKLDCVKMINLIYGLLLIEGLDSTELT